MADFIINKSLTANYGDTQLGPFAQAVSFLYSVFNQSCNVQFAIGKYPGQIFWEDVDRVQYPVFEKRMTNVYGVRFKTIPGLATTPIVNIELDTPIDPEFTSGIPPNGKIDATGAFTPFSTGPTTGPLILGENFAGGGGFNALDPNKFYATPIFNPFDAWDLQGVGIFVGFVPAAGDNIEIALWDAVTNLLVASRASFALQAATTRNGAHIYSFTGAPISLPSGPYYIGIAQNDINGNASLGFVSNMAGGGAYTFTQTYGTIPNTLPALSPFGNGVATNRFPAINLISSRVV